MATFEERFEKACKDGVLPGAVLVGGDVSGKLHYKKAFGLRSLKDNSPMPLDATQWLASSTKLLTTIAVMQCVEKGLLELDTDVTSLLPELKGIQIFKGWKGQGDAKKAILVESKGVITLRHLLTHTSGLTYDMFNPLMKEYRLSTGFTPALFVKGKLYDAFKFPLVFEPGEAWSYGVGIDWAGLMIERVTESTLEDYVLKNVYAPVGAKALAFYPMRNPEVGGKLVDMTIREGGANVFGTAANPDGKLQYIDDGIWNPETEACAGGSGAYGSLPDFAKVLHSLCADDEKLLKKTTTAEMFKPQLNLKSEKCWMDCCNIAQEVNDGMGAYPMGVKKTWGLGGAILMEDVPGGRKKGTMFWGGYPNSLWWIDRALCMSGIFGTHLYLPGDKRSAEWFSEWVADLYTKAGKEKF